MSWKINRIHGAMSANIRSRLFFLATFLLIVITVFSQDNDTTDSDMPPVRRRSKILTGLYVGSYFANKYSASTYNGYGFDANGQRNSFVNSLMYQKIINEYGGVYNGVDQIAQALGVDQGQWSFNESDMAINMHYLPAIMVGLNLKIPLDPKSSLIFNLNGSKLNLGGNFTITTLKPLAVNPANNNNIKTFPITGKEQRLLFQLGFQRIFGDDEKINFFGEIGFVGTLAKFDRNTIYINNLQIDLTNYINQAAYPASIPTKRPIGFGIGAFAGLGINVNMNPKFTVQLLYSPSQERVNLGTNPTLKFQNGVGLRIYYNL